jgi:acetyltransferase
VWLEQAHPPAELPAGVDAERAGAVLRQARAQGRRALDPDAARPLLEAYGVPLPAERLAADPGEAARLAEQIGFPVALKLASPDILHKTEVGGVLLALPDAEAVRRGFETILARARARHPRAEIRGVLVQQMVTGGVEVILGVKRDPVFGPLVMFGLGGVLVEALGDVSFRLAPLARPDIEAMIDEVRASRLLAGWRGAPPADRPALVDALQRIAQLAVDHPQILEMDVNPLIVLPAGQGALAVDVRLTLGGH